MKVIGFVGSPRKKGNTDLLVQRILQGASDAGAETRVFYLNEMNFKGCQGCFFCKENDKCRQQDDMTPVYDEIAEADAVVIGTPIYMWQVTGQTKLFLDRWYAFMRTDFTSRIPKGKKAALVFSQGHPDRNNFQQVFDNLGVLLSMSGMELKDTLVAAGVREAGAVAQDESLMQRALALGGQLAEPV